MGNEQELYVAHPSMFRNSPLRFTCTVAVLLGGVALAVMYGWYALLLSGAAVLILLWWWLKVLGTKITVTDKRTTMRRGILSKNVNEVLHSNVRNIQVDQSFLQRVFGVGTVGISCSGQSGIEIEIDGIPSPALVRQLIDENRHL